MRQPKGAAEALASERAAAQRLMDDLRDELTGILTEQEANPPDDEHDVEGASIGYERARVTALLGRAEARVAEIEAARERMSAHAYGVCEMCGEPIGNERLAALPTTGRCLPCASAGSQPGLGRASAARRFPSRAG